MTAYYQLQVIPFGSDAKGMLNEYHIPYISSIEEYNGKDLALIVAGDATAYETEITHALSVVGIDRSVYCVIDLNKMGNTEKYRSLWKHYNKVENAQTAKDLVTLIQRHLVQPSLIAFDNRDLLDICSQGEYLGSIYVESGIVGLKTVDAPTNAKAFAVGVGFADPSGIPMEQMNALDVFFHKFGEGTDIKWSIAPAPKEEVVIVYSYNK